MQSLGKEMAPEFAQPPGRIISNDTIRKIISHGEVKQAIKHVQSRFLHVLDDNVLDSCAKVGIWKALRKHDFSFKTKLISSIMRFVTFELLESQRQQAKQQNNTCYVSRLWTRRRDERKSVEHPQANTPATTSNTNLSESANSHLHTSCLQDFILDMSPEQKEFFENCFQGGYSDKELARLYQTTESEIICRREVLCEEVRKFLYDEGADLPA